MGISLSPLILRQIPVSATWRSWYGDHLWGRVKLWITKYGSASACLRQTVMGGGCHFLDDSSCSMACLLVVSENFGKRCQECTLNSFNRLCFVNINHPDARADNKRMSESLPVQIDSELSRSGRISNWMCLQNFQKHLVPLWVCAPALHGQQQWLVLAWWMMARHKHFSRFEPFLLNYVSSNKMITGIFFFEQQLFLVSSES